MVSYRSVSGSPTKSLPTTSPMTSPRPRSEIQLDTSHLDADRFVGGGGDSTAVQRRSTGSNNNWTSKRRESAILDPLSPQHSTRNKNSEDDSEEDKDVCGSASGTPTTGTSLGEWISRTQSKSSSGSSKESLFRTWIPSTTKETSFTSSHPRNSDEILAPYAPQGKRSVASSVTSNDTGESEKTRFLIGVCALDSKARSKPMRNILNRLLSTGEFETVIFGDKVILDEPVEKWPTCEFLISFFSKGFPLDKAIAYVNLRKPVCINDLSRQKILWDRRCVFAILDRIGVPCPRRIEVNRDGGPKIDKSLADNIEKQLGFRIDAPRPDDIVDEREDSIIVNGIELRKPFVEKPVSGENHNIHVYYPKSQGGGGRRLFRKVGNKSSEYDPNLIKVRRDASYIYEEFMKSENMEDIKVYTIGPTYCHAETRKSPVVDGLVRRNNDGKEIRFMTKLTDKESKMARRISAAFGQTVCGFDLLRTGKKSVVIDVNGWSFVKGNDDYYDNCARLLRELFLDAAERENVLAKPIVPDEVWTLKAFVAVFRHADRTPKQKARFNFMSKPFVNLLQGHREEVVLRVASQLDTVLAATRKAMVENLEEMNALKQLEMILIKKKDLAGTKVQVKPTYDKEKRDSLVKLQVIVKWGGEFTHSALYQSKDLGENLRKDMIIMNKDVLDNIEIYTSSERRVSASAELFAASFVDNFSKEMLRTRKDLLDDSNAAKELMDSVKKKLKIFLRPSLKKDFGELETGMKYSENYLQQFSWPQELPEPYIVVKETIELMKYHRQVMEENYRCLDVDAIQTRWCCAEDPWLFYERWQKLFKDFCDVEVEKFDPGRVSELYDSLKYDSLHNGQFLRIIFNEHAKDIYNRDEMRKIEAKGNGKNDDKGKGKMDDKGKNKDKEKSKVEVNEKLRQLFNNAKALFNLVAPQEYGITNHEKLEIGMLISMPLLTKIMEDLHEAQNEDLPRTRLYFTKESHIHTLLNCVMQSGMPMKSSRSSIRELDYLTQITFEMYTRSSIFQGEKKQEHALRIALSEGAHTTDLLDTQLDARHCVNVSPRKPLTKYLDLERSFSQFDENLTKIQERIKCEGGWHPSMLGPTVLSAPSSKSGSRPSSVASDEIHEVEE